MRPLADFPPAARRAVRAVLTDIDDTLTDGGRLGAAAYGALERLKAAGFLVVPVTGRPAGWCDLIARQWPVDAVVGENGAFYFRYEEARRRMLRVYAKPAEERAADRRRLTALGEEILAAVPEAALAADQSFRESDLAIDFCEDVAPLPEEAIRRIVALFERAGATAKVSSIHVNGWFGRYDKLTMAERLFAERFGLDLAREREAAVFVGDSPNDQPMFAHFPNSIGVANVRRFAASLASPPRWITAAEGGRGFLELAEALLEARG